MQPLGKQFQLIASVTRGPIKGYTHELLTLFDAIHKAYSWIAILNLAIFEEVFSTNLIVQVKPETGFSHK